MCVCGRGWGLVVSKDNLFGPLGRRGGGEGDALGDGASGQGGGGVQKSKLIELEFRLGVEM